MIEWFIQKNIQYMSKSYSTVPLILICSKIKGPLTFWSIWIVEVDIGDKKSDKRGGLSQSAEHSTDFPQIFQTQQYNCFYL